MESEPRRGVALLDLLVALALAWVLAGSNDFTTGWKVFAFAVTGGCLYAFLRWRLWPWLRRRKTESQT